MRYHCLAVKCFAGLGCLVWGVGLFNRLIVQRLWRLKCIRRDIMIAVDLGRLVALICRTGTLETSSSAPSYLGKCAISACSE